MSKKKPQRMALINSRITEPYLDAVVLTEHARNRIQQRGIKEEWISIILKYGTYIYQKGTSCYKVALTKKGLKEIRRAHKALTEFSKIRSLYLILTQEAIIVTCAYRK